KVVLSADLAITNTAPTSVASGGTIKYSISAKNNGPDAAGSMVVTDNTPAGTTFQSLTANGGTCTTPPGGGTGAISCTVPNVPNGSHLALTLTLNVTASSGSVITDTASVTSSTFDPVTTNNSATATTNVN